MRLVVNRHEVAGSNLMNGLTSIVVGLDFSECSRVALGHAQRIASWAGAQVHPVHVVDAPVDETSKG
jgi:nucleotide-binding universal stress UspA family protein